MPEQVYLVWDEALTGPLAIKGVFSSRERASEWIESVGPVASDASVISYHVDHRLRDGRKELPVLELLRVAFLGALLLGSVYALYRKLGQA